jgi:hypothetical protein
MPRELRDKVYGYLWDEDTVSALDYSALLWPKMMETKRNVLVMAERGELPENTPRFVLSHIVGEQIAFEAMAYLYSKSVHLTLASPEQLRFFFDQDVYGYGLSPKDYELRALKVELRLGEYGYNKRDFHFLLKANKKPGFKLEISILAHPHKLDFVFLHTCVLELSPMVELLRKQNIEVAVKYTGDVFDNIDVEFLMIEDDIEIILEKLSSIHWTGSLSPNIIVPYMDVSVTPYRIPKYLKLMPKLGCKSSKERPPSWQNLR